MKLRNLGRFLLEIRLEELNLRAFPGTAWSGEDESLGSHD